MTGVLTLIDFELNRNHVLTKDHYHINPASKTRDVKLKEDPRINCRKRPLHYFDFFFPG